MNRLLTTLLAGASLLGGATAANATALVSSTATSEIFQFFTTNPNDGTGSYASPYISAVPFSQTFSLPGFNSALGTLTGITFTLTTYTSTSSIFTNTTGSTQSYQYIDATLPIELAGPGGTQKYKDVNNVTQYNGIILDNGESDAGAGSAPSPSSNVIESTTTQTLTDSQTLSGSALSPYVTASSLNVGFIGNSVSVSANIPANTTAGGSGTAGASLQIEYDFNPAVVPEPASMALLGAGLLGAGLVRRRTSK